MGFIKRTDGNGNDIYSRLEGVTTINVETINGTQGRVTVYGSDTHSRDFGTRAQADAFAANLAETVGIVVVD